MMYPQVDLKKWTETYDLEVLQTPCPRCGHLQTLNIPFAVEQWRGLQAEIHECGQQYQASVAKSVNKEHQRIWKDLFTFLD